MLILVLNCGSSSVKFQLLETSRSQIASSSDKRIAKGVVERIGGQALITFEWGNNKTKETAPIRDHRQAIDKITTWLTANDDLGIHSISEISAVGHRVVHGGERFTTSQLITPEVIDGIEACIDLAPLHNPANLKGIAAARSLFGPGLPQVAVFDTSFHTSMPESSFLYGIPYSLYRKHKIRRYGFHGTSHRFIGYQYRQLLNLEKSDVNIISLHLGNGCSACAIKNGKSFDTSMGLTPLEGLLMGTRSGDLDPSVVEVIAQGEGLTLSEVDSLLSKQSGLLGISGLTGDMRDLLFERGENNDRRARLAIEVFCLRVKKYIGAYLAEMGGADAIVFTGGIGENSSQIRTEICEGLSFLGLELDAKLNSERQIDAPKKISTHTSSLNAYVIPTNEELLIARDTVRIVEPAPK